MKDLTKKPSDAELNENAIKAQKTVDNLLELKKAYPNMPIVLIFGNYLSDIKDIEEIIRNKIKTEMQTNDKQAPKIGVLYVKEIPSQTERERAINNGVFTHFFFGPDFQGYSLPEEILNGKDSGKVKKGYIFNLSPQGDIENRN